MTKISALQRYNVSHSMPRARTLDIWLDEYILLSNRRREVMYFYSF